MCVFARKSYLYIYLVLLNVSDINNIIVLGIYIII